MIRLVDGEIYVMDEESLSPEILREFCSEKHENDIICVNKKGQKIYINAEDIKKQRIDENCYEILRENVFSEIYSNPHIDGPVPLLDSKGNPVMLVKYYATSYDHIYDCDMERIDTSVFDLYECVCLCGVNEYSVLMYQQCFHTYKGKVILFQEEWEEILPYLGKGSEYAEVIITADKNVVNREMRNKKHMILDAFASNVAGYRERCKIGYFSYDEIMTLVYFFTQHKTISERGDKKAYVIDVRCDALGLVALANCFGIPCAYLISKGYIPIINIISSDNSIYSDSIGDDIWSKFFRQPIGINESDLEKIEDVTLSPLTYVTFSGRWLMQQMTGCEDMDLMKPEYFNDRLLQHINGYRKCILQKPEKTLGVLIRGTDYVAAKPAGHAVQATPEQVIEKVKEFSKEWDFENIFVATEDAEALAKMRAAFGGRVKFVDQKRFVLQKGEYIWGEKEKDTWKPGDGWQYGADYLCAMVLLSECAFFIASGYCTGTGLVEKLADGRGMQSYVFDLGLYE